MLIFQLCPNHRIQMHTIRYIIMINSGVLLCTVCIYDVIWQFHQLYQGNQTITKYYDKTMTTLYYNLIDYTKEIISPLNLWKMAKRRLLSRLGSPIKVFPRDWEVRRDPKTNNTEFRSSQFPPKTTTNRYFVSFCHEHLWKSEGLTSHPAGLCLLGLPLFTKSVKVKLLIIFDYRFNLICVSNVHGE